MSGSATRTETRDITPVFDGYHKLKVQPILDALAARVAELERQVAALSGRAAAAAEPDPPATPAVPSPS